MKLLTLIGKVLLIVVIFLVAVNIGSYIGTYLGDVLSQNKPIYKSIESFFKFITVL